MKNLFVTLALLLTGIVILCLLLTPKKTPRILKEGFKEKLSLSREKIDPHNRIPLLGDSKDSKVYVRLYEVVNSEMLLYKYDIDKIKKITGMNQKSRVLDAGCGVGRHFQLLKKNIPKITLEGVDKSMAMIQRARVRNPGSEFYVRNLRDRNIYKKDSLTHILCLHETLHHNSYGEVSQMLNNFHKWLIPEGYLVIHLLDPNRLDPGPRAHSQYFKSDDGVRHSLTYFESFSHEAWWEKVAEKKDWYRYCEKYLFPDKSVKIKTSELWIPDRKRIVEMITEHGFVLREIVELKDIEVPDFNLYIFRKKAL